jgi:hypothetical protein
VIARALLALAVTLTLAAAAIAPPAASARPPNYVVLAEQGEHQSEAWRSGGWYCEYLHCTGEYPLLTIWGDVRMFESVDALDLAAPSPGHRAQVNRFGHASERYWNP